MFHCIKIEFEFKYNLMHMKNCIFWQIRSLIALQKIKHVIDNKLEKANVKLRVSVKLEIKLRKIKVTITIQLMK